ncbi:MAG: MMPL family transporter [Alphaproteobacteria bacterium]|nr:MMPL family transporter [Alphaproteobacteria bacterium]
MHVILLSRFVTALVDAARRCAGVVAITILLLAIGSAFLTATHLSVDTDIEHMLPSDAGWRRDELALDKAFPQNDSLIVVVIDGDTGAVADAAAAALTSRLRAEPSLFQYVRQPDGGRFFERNGLLYLSVPELQSVSDQLIQAQALLGSLAHDPSLRGLFGTLALFFENAGTDKATVERLDPTVSVIAAAINSAVSGRPEPLSWQKLMTGRPPETRDTRHFVLARPVLDFDALEPGAKASTEIRRVAAELGIDAGHGLRLRLTGPVPLGDEQFATLQQGAVSSLVISILAVLAILFAAVRSMKLVAAILVTLLSGLVITGGFAALAIGSLNLISIAFGVLFIGLAVDFSIQFSIRYRDERHRQGSGEAALRGTAATLGPSLILASGATAIGFLSFVPTPYVGIRDLGWIAGAGMIIAIILNFTLLPALLTLSRPRGEPEAIGFRRAAPLDEFLLNQRRWVIAGAALLALGSLALLPFVRFDFDPLNLKDPYSESVQTARDLMRDPMTTPYTAEVLTPSIDAATQLADRLGELPEVAQVVTGASFVPTDQQQKLPIISDLSLLLGPSLSGDAPLAPPGDAEVLKSMGACRNALRPLAAASGSGSPAANLAAALDAVLARGGAVVPALRQALLSGLKQQLEMLSHLTQAEPVTLALLPPELRDSWIAVDGRARIEVFPRGDAHDPVVLERFVAAVRGIAPNVTGTPVTIQESGRLISSAFLEAGLIAVGVIVVLLVIGLRRLRDVALVVGPLLLAAMLTLAATVVAGMPLNYANIIALPLLLGIGVAFDIYFVMNWRAGVSHHLQSSTARAVIFSALTTMSAFGSLAISRDPGTAGMGELLALSLGCTLFCTLLILPALLGPSPHATDG